MGKTRKYKLRNDSKCNPLRVVQNSDKYSAELGNGPLDAICCQLQSASIEEKLNGLHSLSVLAAYKDKLSGVYKCEVIRITSSLLCANEVIVRIAAAGALRNISTHGTNVCEYLVAQDLLTPLLALLKEYTQNTSWAPIFDRTANEQIDLFSEVFWHAINLLWNLCESSSLALEIFNQSEQLEGLMRCLDYKIFGFHIALSFAQCLLVVSENNPTAWNIINKHASTLVFLLSGSGEHIISYMRTLVAGILSNVPTQEAVTSLDIFTALHLTLDQNHIESLSRLSVTQDSDHRCESEINDYTKEDESMDAVDQRCRQIELAKNHDIAVDNMEYLLDAQRLSAEIITNMCSADEEEWVNAEDDVLSANEDIEYEFGERNSYSNSNLWDGDKLPPELIKVMQSMGLIDKLWQRAQPIPSHLSLTLRESNIALISKVNNLRISSLICLQNLFNILTTDDLGGRDAIYNIWIDLYQQVFKESHDISVLEPLTSLMRSVLERLKTHKHLFINMTTLDLQVIIDGIRGSSVSNVAELRANWLRILGTLACLLPEDFVKIILPYIVSSCIKEENVWTISEGLDSLMDVFSDNDWNDLILDWNLYESVKELKGLFKTKLHQQRRELKDRFPAVRTVLENFSRFLKYVGEMHNKAISQSFN